jgi:hypothetical protein
MNSSYLRATHLENVPKKYENPKQQSSHNIREAEMGNVVTVNTKKTYRGLEVQLHSFLILTQNQRWSTSHPGRFNLGD